MVGGSNPSWGAFFFLCVLSRVRKVFPIHSDRFVSEVLKENTDRNKRSMSGVVDFYSGLERSSREAPSQIMRLRLWNNFAKALALQTFVPRGLPTRMLDIACGKGSDFFKAQLLFGAGLELYTGFDITEKAIVDFRERLRGRSVTCASVETLVMDARVALPPTFNERYSLVNIAFAFHYFFESFESIAEIFSNLSRCLMDHGRVVITTGDFGEITSKLRTKAHGRKEFRVVSETLDLMARIVEVDGLNGYFFELLDGPGKYAVRAQEFFVPPETVHAQANAFGMDVVHESNLLDFASSGAWNPLAHQMGIEGTSGELTESERAIMKLYKLYVLEKRPRIRAPVQVRYGVGGGVTVETETAFEVQSSMDVYDDYEF